MKRALFSTFIALLLARPASGVAQSATDSTAGATSAAPCATAEHRQFDFWAGSWDVRNPDGTLAGENRIEPILNGCALRESWKGAGGMSGISLNAYSPMDGRWHQTWLDDRGIRLELAGGIEDGKMVLTGEGPIHGRPGARLLHRITWEALEEGRVRQTWESSEDGGATWGVVFQGTYAPKP